jgi:hypothetical protein
MKKHTLYKIATWILLLGGFILLLSQGAVTALGVMLMCAGTQYYYDDFY